MSQTFDHYRFIFVKRFFVMKKEILTRLVGLGVLSWLIPFAVSFMFFKPGGELLVPYATFKSSIMAVGVLSGSYLLFQFFKAVDAEFVKYGVLVGIIWLLLNLLLDILVLVPMMKSTLSEYFTTIGIGYISIPAVSIAMGYLLQQKVSR